MAITGKVEKIASGHYLKRPNGLAVHEGALWVLTFGGDGLFRLEDGKKTAVQKLPKGSLDGLVRPAPDGERGDPAPAA